MSIVYQSKTSPLWLTLDGAEALNIGTYESRVIIQVLVTTYYELQNVVRSQKPWDGGESSWHMEEMLQ